MSRGFWLRLHRYAGLAMAIFLVIAGLTGSVIAFQTELDAWLNPHLFRTNSQGTALSPSELIARLERLEPRLRVTYIPLKFASSRVRPSGYPADALIPVTATEFELDYDEIFVDPRRGDILGQAAVGRLLL